MLLRITHTADTHAPQLVPVLPESLPEIRAFLAENEADFLPYEAEFKAKEGEILRLFGASQSFWLLGLGSKPTLQTIRLVFRRLSHQQKSKQTAFALDAAHFRTCANPDAALTAALEGFRLGFYQLGRWKTEASEPVTLRQLHLLGDVRDGLIWRSEVLSDAIRYAMNLVNAPGNKLTPTDLSDSAVQLSKLPNVTTRPFNRDGIRQMGMGGLLAVNGGSPQPATFSVVDYRPENPKATVALVGKGVTFDTGGINLKPTDNMYWMKCDMGGAAIVLGAIQAIARLALPIRVIGAIPATENKTGYNAYLPGDVITMYNGKTVEVEDTDAEGRLILADAIAYVIQNYETDYLLDFATLTGACVTALGYHAAGLFTPNDALSEQLTEAGTQTEERLWRLPLFDAYNRQIQSDIADLKNLGGRPAGASTAAKFIEAFTDGHPNWAHLDVAGVVFGDDEFGRMRHATGWGVRLVTAWAERISRD